MDVRRTNFFPLNFVSSKPVLVLTLMAGVFTQCKANKQSLNLSSTGTVNADSHSPTPEAQNSNSLASDSASQAGSVFDLSKPISAKPIPWDGRDFSASALAQATGVIATTSSMGEELLPLDEKISDYIPLGEYVSECAKSYFGDFSRKRIMVVSDEVLTDTFQFFLDSQCQTLGHTQNWSLRFKSAVTNQQIHFLKAQVTKVEEIVAFQDLAQLRLSLKFCDLETWKVNSTVDVTGRFCSYYGVPLAGQIMVYGFKTVGNSALVVDSDDENKLTKR
jgi:hypothetical protein